jgi:D-glycero-alpha-D-manno-heptose-7-phosphate kinase
MIISQTPYRVSFVGGGTDLPAFYEREYGAVLSLTINRHIYVTVSPRFDSTTRIAYTKTEIAENIDDIQHTIIREALRLTKQGPHTEITTIGDVPAGTGMGSSSALTVGTINALNAFRGRITSSQTLAEEACRIEIDVLGKPIGKQDQYASAYGGLNYFRFNSDGTVYVEPVPCSRELISELESRALLFYTDNRRDADKILKQQSAGTEKKFDTLRQMRDLVDGMRDSLSTDSDIDEFANLLHQGWELKRSLGFGITNENVDAWYAAARSQGAQGGKLLGAGGGGFLFLIAPKSRHQAIRDALGNPRELPFEFEKRGSRIIFISDHSDLSMRQG